MFDTDIPLDCKDRRAQVHHCSGTNPGLPLLVDSPLMAMVAVYSPCKRRKRDLDGPEVDRRFPASASNSREPIMVEISPCMDRCVAMVSTELLDVRSNA